MHSRGWCCHTSMVVASAQSQLFSSGRQAVVRTATQIASQSVSAYLEAGQ